MPAISFLPFLQNVPYSSRLLVALLVLLSIAAFGLTNLARENSPANPGPLGIELPWLVLVPGKSLYYPWVLLTAGLVELNIVEVSQGETVAFVMLGTQLESDKRDLEEDKGPKCSPPVCTVIARQ